MFSDTLHQLFLLLPLLRPLLLLLLQACVRGCRTCLMMSAAALLLRWR
jgi:hypothetical protein